MAKIESAIAQGANSIKEIAEITGCSRQALYTTYKEFIPNNIFKARGYPRGMKRPVKRNLKWDALIEEGRDICEIGKLEGGVTRQAIHDYIKRTGQHETWKLKREEIANNQYNEKRAFFQTRKSLVQLLENRVVQLINQEEDLAMKRAIIHYIKTRKYSDNIPFETVHQLFRIHQTFEESGEPISYYKLGKVLEKVPTFAKRLLNEQGLQSDYAQATKYGKRLKQK
jgi:predicted DNA-binding protein YlxM (UPF0122 family)